MQPSEIKAPPTMAQLYSLLGEAHAENMVLKSIIAEHPEIIASHNVAAPPATPAAEPEGE